MREDKARYERGKERYERGKEGRFWHLDDEPAAGYSCRQGPCR